MFTEIIAQHVNAVIVNYGTDISNFDRESAKSTSQMNNIFPLKLCLNNKMTCHDLTEIYNLSISSVFNGYRSLTQEWRELVFC